MHTMSKATEHTASKKNIVRDRLVSIFDNVAANIIVAGLFVIIPVGTSLLFNLGLFITLIITVITLQFITIIMVFLLIPKTVEEKQSVRLLARSSENDDIYIFDQYHLPHPIRDEKTRLYFKQVLGYQIDEIPLVSSQMLKPFGQEIIAIDDWELPRTPKDEKWHEAYRALKFERKYFESRNGINVLCFEFRWSNEYNFQIQSARLSFDTDPPLTSRDIAPQNQPNHFGTFDCVLLFDGQSVSKILLPNQDFRLELLIKRNLTTDEQDRIKSRKIGMIIFNGVYREIEEKYYKDA